MSANDPQLARLQSLLINERIVEAESLARQLGPPAVGALAGLADHENADVRIAVLEVAASLQHPEVCRLALRMAFDSDEQVGALAANQLGKCSTAEFRGPLLEALEKKPPPALAAVLALQLGRVGTADDLPALGRLRAEATDPAERHALSVALAKLGDSAARTELEKQLAAPLAEDRVQALRDIEYVGDVQLVANFAGVLDDRRDVVPLSMPDLPPVVFARVCDIAVLTMLRLGVKLSYTFDMLTRLEEQHLDEAKRYVEQSARRP